MFSLKIKHTESVASIEDSLQTTLEETLPTLTASVEAGHLQTMTVMLNSASLLLGWQTSVNEALKAFLTQVGDLSRNLPQASVIISYVPGSPRLESVTQTLATYLHQAGLSITVKPLSSDADVLALQLANQSHAIIVCAPEYAQQVEDNPKIRQYLEAFGIQQKNALQPLLCQGGFGDTALKIVDKHYLIRDCKAVLSEDPLCFMPAFFEIILNISGYQGLGLLPDILSLTEEEFAIAKIAYKKYYDQLAIAERRATIDYRLTMSLIQSLEEHPFKTHLTTLPLLKGVVGFDTVIDEFLSSTAQISLFLCPTKADTGLTSLGVAQVLQRKHQRVLTIDCSVYTGKASANCVRLALQQVGLKTVHRPILQEEPIVILLNGYENIGTYDNLYLKNNLSLWKNLKLIITCRADFFKCRGYLSCFLAEASDRKAIDSLSVYKVPGFASAAAKKTAVSWKHSMVSPPVESSETLCLHPRQQAIRIELKTFLNNLHQLWIGMGYFVQESINIFISYAWEGSQEALVRQQGHLSHLSEDLHVLGFSPWLDIERMSGDIDQQMAGNIANSHGVLVIGTARYTERSTQDTNVKKEFDAILKKSQQDMAFKVFPLQFSEASPFPLVLMNHPHRCDFRNIDAGYLDCLAHPTQGLLPKLLVDAAIKQTLYEEEYVSFQAHLQLLIGKHLIVNQGKDDVHAYDMDNRLKGYIEAHCLEAENAPLQTRVDLQHYFKQFLDDPNAKTVVILARAGAGKSCFALATFKALLTPWLAYQAISTDRPQWLPLYIPLRNYAKNPEHCVALALQEQFQLSPEEIDSLKQGLNHLQHLLFILDGYDELGSGVRPNITQSLADWPRAKLLITARPEHFDRDHSPIHSLSLYSAEGGILFDSVQLTYVAPFTPEDIQRYVAYYSAGKSQATYHTLEALPGMMSLLDNPFLLTLVLQSLPQLLKNRQTERAVTRTDIYNAFTDTWFLQETYGRELEPTVCQAFSQALAFRFFQEKTLSIAPNSSENPALWAFFNDEVHQAAQDAAPLRLSGGRYSFIHKSLYEYFAASYLWTMIVNPQGLSVWQTRLLIEERAIIDFLAERLMTSPSREQEEVRLLDMILATRAQPDKAVAASSASTVLNSAHTNFQRLVPSRDFSSIHISRADLSGAFLEYFNFAHSDVSDVIFYDATLYQTNFHQANLTGTRFITGDSFIFTERGEGSLARHPHRLDIIAYGEDNDILIGRLSDGHIEKRLCGHTSNIRRLVFRLDGTLASVSDDKTIRLWDMTSPLGKECLKTLAGPSSISSVAFGLNGILATGSLDSNDIHLWDLQREKSPLNRLKGNTHPVSALAFGLDTMLASVCVGMTIRLWDTTSASGAQCIKTITIGYSSIGPSGVLSLALSLNGILASGNWDSTIQLWDMTSASGKESLKTLTGHASNVVSLVFGPDGTLASASTDNTIRLWNTTNASGKECLKILAGHTSKIFDIAFGSDGTLVSRSLDKTIRLWGTSKAVGEEQITTERTGSVNSLAFSPTGVVASSQSDDNTIYLWDMTKVPATGCFKTLTGHTKAIASLAFGPEGMLVSVSSDNTLRLWDMTKAASTECFKILTGSKGWISSLAFGSEGMVASGGFGKERIITVRMMLASSNLPDHSISLWNTTNASGKEYVKSLKGHTDWVSSLAFCRDGKLVSGSNDHTIRLWNTKKAAREECIKILTGHTGAVVSLAFNLEGMLASSANFDGTIRLWNMANPSGKECVKKLGWYPSEQTSLVFSPDGRWLFFCNYKELLCFNTYAWDNAPMHLVLKHASKLAINNNFLAIATRHTVMVLDLTDFPQEWHWVMAVPPQLQLSQCNIFEAQGLTTTTQKLLEQEGVINCPDEHARRRSLDTVTAFLAHNTQQLFNTVAVGGGRTAATVLRGAEQRSAMPQL